MITNQPVFYRKVQYHNPEEKTPFYIGPGTPSGARILYFIPNPLPQPNIILRMKIINAHPEGRPFEHDTYFAIRRLNFMDNIYPHPNRTCLDFMPVIDPYIDIFTRDHAFIMYSSKPAYFYLIYDFTYDKIGLKKLLPHWV